jgi:glycosyltransferase involved in cell wall biosynthesis
VQPASPGAKTSRISVAMCTYNGARHLHKQLDSIAAQTHVPDELVICDDRSQDETSEIIESFAKTTPFRVRLIVNDRNLGSSKNFEKAMRLCTGDLIALSDQDDIWYPQKLEVQCEFFSNHPELGGLFSDGDLMDQNSVSTGIRIWETIHFDSDRQELLSLGHLSTVLLRNNVVTGATLMVRSSELSFCLPVPGSWVHDGWIAWMLGLHSKMGFVRESLIRYRMHGSQQVGLPPKTAYQQFLRARQTKADSYKQERLMFEDLLKYLEQTQLSERDSLQRAVEKKIDLLRFRECLPAHFSSRVSAVLARTKLYNLYSQGWKSMLKDTLLRA